MNTQKLAWLCRRGMRELDVLLSHYAASQYVNAHRREQACFEELLAESDDTLWRYFYRDLIPTDAEMASLVDTIRRSAPSYP
jgi:antitoxin CptB